MKIQRTIPPAATPLYFRDLLHGLAGVFLRKRNLKKLEREMREYFGVKHTFLVSSGKAALTLILIGLKSLSSRRRALIPAYTCFSVPSAIIKAGLDLSLCDVDPKTLDFEFHCLERSLDERTLCVIPTHLLGLPSDIDRVTALSKEKEVFVVEDAAQAMGGQYKNRMLGTLGDVAFFSLGRGKSITCGSGGVILTNSDEIAKSIRAEYSKLKREPALGVFRNWCEVFAMRLLIDPRVYWLPSKLPFLKLGETKFYDDFPVRRMDGVRLGLLSHWQERLEQSVRARHLMAKDFVDRLNPCGEVIPSLSVEQPVYLRLPIMMKNKKVKEKLCALSDEKGLGINPLYPTAIQAIKELQDRVETKEFPGSERVAERLVTLPVHHRVRNQDREKICAVFDSLDGVTSNEILPCPIPRQGRGPAPAQASILNQP